MIRKLSNKAKKRLKIASFDLPKELRDEVEEHYYHGPFLYLQVAEDDGKAYGRWYVAVNDEKLSILCEIDQQQEALNLLIKRINNMAIGKFANEVGK